MASIFKVTVSQVSKLGGDEWPTVPGHEAGTVPKSPYQGHERREQPLYELSVSTAW